jgi:hypothetical protein
MPNEPDKNPNQGNKPTTHQLPIDLANKVIVKPANEKMSMQQTTFRTIQQAPQMRVVRMPASGGTGGAQIIQTTQLMPQTILKPTTIPGRSTITVSKSPATYLPRVTTLNTIQGAKGTQQIRTPTPPSSVGISPAFVRASITPRTSSPNAVLSQGTTAWVSGNVSGAMQVVPQQIIRSTITPNRTITANLFGQAGNQQNSTISVSTSTSNTSGQPTYVATVLPQQGRQQGATIVYTSQQQQPYIQGQVQRMGIATATANARQIRPIQTRIPTTGIRVNTSSLSIRQNVPGLAPTTVLATQPRNSLASSTSISNTIPARIFQVQSQTANVMLPIIVNNNRLTHTVKNPLQQGIIAHVSKLTSGSDGNSMTNTMPSTMVASIQPNHSVQSQVSQGNQGGTIYTTQSTPSGNQIITVSQQQQQQIINSQHQGGKVQTVVPLAIGSRNANIPIKTITVSAASGIDTVHRNLTTNAAGNLQATTIMPIAKLVSQQQVQQSQGTPVYIHTRVPTVSTITSTAQSQVISVSTSSSTPTFSNAGTPTATVYYEQTGGSDKAATSTSTETSSYPGNVRYSEKMIHSIIASSFQNQSGNQQGANPIRFSPLVVDNQQQQQQQTSHIIQVGGPSNIIKQQTTVSEAPTHMIVPISSQVPTSPRGNAAIRKQTDSPKGPKKQAKMKNYQIAESLSQMRVPQRPIPASVAQLTQNVKPVETPIQLSTASSPKTCESPSHADEWSDGSTTVSIPNSPNRSEEDDLDAMIAHNQFNKTPSKVSAVKREAGEHQQVTPRKKMKQSSDSTVGDLNNENNENAVAKKKELVLKKPQASLLQTYNQTQTWKQTHNHYLRYSDVRVRDERKPTVMDLANQPKVAQRVDGWKTHLIGSEITELVC